MQHEPFWCLREKEEAYSMMAAEPSLTLRNAEKKDLPRDSYSTKAMRSAFCWAEIDPALFQLLQNQEARGHLRVILISTYLQNQPIDNGNVGAFGVVSTLFYLLAS